MADKILTCRNCGSGFTFTEDEQDYYSQRRYSWPTTCADCHNSRTMAMPVNNYGFSRQNSSSASAMSKADLVDALRQSRAEHREERRQAQMYRRAMQDSDDSLEMYLKCVGIIGFFYGMSLIGANLFPLLDGPLGYLLMGAAILSALTKVVIDVKHGHSFVKSLLTVLILDGIIYGLEYGLFWYLKENYLAHPEALFNLNFPTPTPKQLRP